MNVQPIQYEHGSQARYIVAHCRSRDRAEIDAVVGLEYALANLEAWLSAALVVRVFWHQSRPAAFVAVHYKTAKTVEMSMIATDAWHGVTLSVAKWAKRSCMPMLLEMGYRRAEVRSIDGHEDAQAFLEWLGFTLECRCPEYGAGGETFLQYAWRSKDHADVFRS